MEAACEKVLAQIDEKNYIAAFEGELGFKFETKFILFVFKVFTNGILLLGTYFSQNGKTNKKMYAEKIESRYDVIEAGVIAAKCLMSYSGEKHCLPAVRKP